MRAMGIQDKPAAPASPWQNGFAERLIGSIRHECVDHVIVLGEAHLRRILRTYARCYNDIGTHRSLGKVAPVSRSVQRIGSINSRAILGGLHHRYFRGWIFGTHRFMAMRLGNTVRRSKDSRTWQDAWLSGELHFAHSGLMREACPDSR